MKSVARGTALDNPCDSCVAISPASNVAGGGGVRSVSMADLP